MDRVPESASYLDSARRAGYRRPLLPGERDLIDVLGITEDEYFVYLALTSAYDGSRPAEYAHIPDVRNDPVSIIISLVVGVALSAVSALLAPKPAQQNAKKQKAPIRRPDAVGPNRFSPLGAFDSVQELATLGAPVPLVFARQGVRVNSQLVWSQMLSLGSSQQLRAIMVFSAGDLGEKPSYWGYALGDQKLSSINDSQIALYFQPNGGRTVEQYDDAYGRYPETLAPNTETTDPFATWWDLTRNYEPLFIGARTPSKAVQFGLFNPAPNGNRFQLPYELILRLSSADAESKRDLEVKAWKNEAPYPRQCAITQVASQFPGKGDLLAYTLSPTVENSDRFKPWGMTDVNNRLTGTREQLDDLLREGTQFMAGTAICVVSNAPTNAWAPGQQKIIILKVTEDGGEVEQKDTGDTFHSADTFVLQRVELATVSNTRKCAATEFGIKSSVWRRINGFANVNDEPLPSRVWQFEDDNQQFDLGTVTKYTTRYSFFRLQVKQINDTAWRDIGGIDHIFCIKGNTPQPQYNYLRVIHPKTEQYEYRFLPVPGNFARRYLAYKQVFVLGKGTGDGFSFTNALGQWFVSFRAQRLVLTEAVRSNNEWYRYLDATVGSGDPADGVLKGGVVSVNANNNGAIPVGDRAWRRVDGPRYSTSPRTLVERWVRLDINMERWTFYWDGNLIGGIDTVRNPGLVWIDTTDKGEPVRFYAVKCTSEPQCSNYELIQYWSVEAWKIVEDSSMLEYRYNVPAVPQPVGSSGINLYFDTKYNPHTGAFAWVLAANPPARSSGFVNGETVIVQHVVGQSVPRFSVSVTTDLSAPLNPSDPNEPVSLNPNDAISDYFVYDAESSSHQDGPEHTIAYVNEIFDKTAALPQGPQYDNLAHAGLRLTTSAAGIDFQQVSAYVRKGVKSRRLTVNKYESINTLPDIAYALLTRADIGAGASLGTDCIVDEDMRKAAWFCETNGFYWDGVLAEQVNLREWIYEQASYCLLDFVIRGGQFSLVPAVPILSSGHIDYNGKPEIRALFTDGNVADLQTSFLSAQERQMFKAHVLYRFDTENGFPEQRLAAVSYVADAVNTDELRVETFDLSEFCRSREHAIIFAKYALMVRRFVDHGVNFKTTPNNCFGLAPGQYFRLVVKTTHLDRRPNGSISKDGTVQCAEKLSGDYNIVYWVPGTVGLREARMTVTNGATADTAIWGSLFSIAGQATTTNNVYKAESIAYDEEGLVEVSASYAPLTERGTLKILDWFYPDGVTPVFAVEEA